MQGELIRVTLDRQAAVIMDLAVLLLFRLVDVEVPWELILVNHYVVRLLGHFAGEGDGKRRVR